MKNIKGCNEYNKLSRRSFLSGAAGLGTLFAVAPSWLPRVALGQGGSSRDVIIQIYLRGGIDGLTFCVPHGDNDYYSRRPTQAVPRPSSGQAGAALDLDGFFGFVPTMQPLMPAYQDQNLLMVHATGAVPNNWTRSHFDAQRWMEVGKPNDASVATGWLGRHLATVTPLNPNTSLRGIALEQGLIQSLRGGPNTLPLPDPDDYGYGDAFGDWVPAMAQWIGSAYSRMPEPLKSSAMNTQATIALLDSIDFQNYVPAGGANYPDTGTAQGLKATAAMLRAQIGLEVVGLDLGGWDTHADQGANGGFIAGHLSELADALGAFYQDLIGAGFNNFLVVCMSEFGRTADENASMGTDHGTGNAMLLMGPKVAGGRVLANWPGLADGQLFEDQDLAPTIDYRDLLAEIVDKRLSNAANLNQVFPGYSPTYRGVIKP